MRTFIRGCRNAVQWPKQWGPLCSKKTHRSYRILWTHRHSGLICRSVKRPCRAPRRLSDEHWVYTKHTCYLIHTRHVRGHELFFSLTDLHVEVMNSSHVGTQHDNNLFIFLELCAMQMKKVHNGASDLTLRRMYMCERKDLDHNGTSNRTCVK